MFAAFIARLVPYKATAICVLLAALVAGLIVQGAQLSAARATVTAKNDSLKALQTLIEVQNAGIEAMKADAVKRETAAKKAVAAANATTERARAHVAHIEAAPVPTDCQGAMQWLAAEGAKLEGNR